MSETLDRDAAALIYEVRRLTQEIAEIALRASADNGPEVKIQIRRKLLSFESDMMQLLQTLIDAGNRYGSEIARLDRQKAASLLYLEAVSRSHKRSIIR